MMLRLNVDFAVVKLNAPEHAIAAFCHAHDAHHYAETRNRDYPFDLPQYGVVTLTADQSRHYFTAVE